MDNTKRIIESQEYSTFDVDPETPTIRLHILRGSTGEGSNVIISEEKMTSAQPTAQIIDVMDEIMLLPRTARWLRDVLNTMDLEDDAAGE